MRALVLSAWLAAVAVTQQPAAFADLPFPAGVPGGVDSLGKLVHVFDGAAVHVFSAFTRSWHHLAAAPGTTTHQTNDVLLVRDGATWNGFGATRGRFAPLAVGPSAVLVNAVSRNNDSVLLVRDGAWLHAFSGFTGRWVSRPISAAAATDVQRHVALLADGALVSGFDAMSGQWHDLPAPGPVLQLSTDGVCGIALTATTVLGFSALRGSWRSAPGLPGAALVRDDDWVAFHDGVQVLAYSGLTGTFATAVTGPLLATRGEDLFGVFTTVGGAHLFSAITGTFGQVQLSAQATLRTNVACAVVTDGPQVIAWSAPRGAFATLAIDSSNEAVAGTVVAAVERASGRPFLFSALTGTWQAAPADVLPGLPRVSTVAALLPTSTGFRAFSARSGAFVPLVAPGSVGESNENSAPVVAWDSSAIHVFDARIDRWIDVARTGSGTPIVQIWRTSVLVLDGNEVLGFGAQAGAVHREPLAEPVVAFRANSESASVTTATHLLGFGALPLPMSLVQFPDFRRVLVIGAPYRLHLRLLAGDLALLGLSARAAVPQPIAGLGELLLAPATIEQFAVAREADADRAVFTVQVPNDPALQGAFGWSQALVAPAAGAPYLTDAVEVWIG